LDLSSGEQAVIHKIVLAIDGSGAAERATHVAAEMVRSFDAELDVLHVQAPVLALAGVGAGDTGSWGGSIAARQGVERAGHDVLARAGAILDAADIDYTARLAHGSDIEQMCEDGHMEGADVIVIGCRLRVESELDGDPFRDVATRVAPCAPYTIIIPE
jgi:nucleotide-binding universal stress UspA family protein